MTSALSAAARHLRVVDETASHDPAARDEPGDRQPGEQTPLVGYVVLVPQGTDPNELFTADGTRVRLLPALPADLPPARQLPGQPPPQPPVAAAEGLHVDPDRHTAQTDGRQLDLTYLEFELLAHFVAHPHRVHSRSHLVSALWGYSHVGDGRTVDVHVARLRRKLGRFRDTIVTVRRVGYKYEPGRAL
ncbi:winged helix-turn-helix transcriptional regulator [Streptomyces bathyalis]|uniref:Winged helix-turn-helix transcriptional regulator n=1 Tax=Streptomyces bathyalis TaxID=2710756 RepID=A0A7T1T401_9ACTN|nr:winged helix-turn-helix domain-containing protein [Streptomyces bathyalis]QPP05983.1 winged helix-turn-helix transcriptional regulator [Streptomyces bathyalis]